MCKIYTKSELEALGMDKNQIDAIIATYETDRKILENTYEKEESNIGIPTSNVGKMVDIHKHDVDVHVDKKVLVPTSISQIASYKSGTIVELPPFADGQPFVARVARPSMLALVKTGKIPNSLLNQATSLFANGAGALNAGGKNGTNVSELFDVIDVIVDAALLEPTLGEIRSVDMELTDDQLMAIFAYTQRGVKALEQFRTE